MQLPHFLIPELLGGGALLFFLVGIYMCRVGSTNQKKYDYLKDPPHVWINGIPHGLVQVRGRVMIDNPLTSPLTQTDSCYYQTIIQREKPGKPGEFKTIHSEFKDREFVIDDGTGKIPVISSGAVYDLPQVYSAVVDTSLPAFIKDSRGPFIGQATPPSEDHLELYLARHGIRRKSDGGEDEETGDSGGVFRVIEHCLAMGAETSVFGTCDVCFETGQPRGQNVIAKNPHLPTLLITNSIEIKVGPRLHLIAVACFTFGVLMIGLSLASVLLLVYPHFV